MKIHIRRETLNLFAGEENLSILQITDIHLWFSTKVLKQLLLIINQEKPDVIVLTGDYYDLPQGARNFRKFLLEISQTNRVLFITGNHDVLWGKNVSSLLLNIPKVHYVEGFIFTHRTKKGNTFNFTSWENRKLLPMDLSKNILLIHNPEEILENELQGVHLLFAGHLHGCQFIFFKLKDGSNFPGNLYYKQCADRKKIKNTTLIVSKGLGDTLPLRWNCPKEVVLVTIV